MQRSEISVPGHVDSPTDSARGQYRSEDPGGAQGTLKVWLRDARQQSEELKILLNQSKTVATEAAAAMKRDHEIQISRLKTEISCLQVESTAANDGWNRSLKAQENLKLELHAARTEIEEQQEELGKGTFSRHATERGRNAADSGQLELLSTENHALQQRVMELSKTLALAETAGSVSHQQDLLTLQGHLERTRAMREQEKQAAALAITSFQENIAILERRLKHEQANVATLENRGEHVLSEMKKKVRGVQRAAVHRTCVQMEDSLMLEALLSWKTISCTSSWSQHASKKHMHRVCQAQLKCFFTCWRTQSEFWRSRELVFDRIENRWNRLRCGSHFQVWLLGTRRASQIFRVSRRLSCNSQFHQILTAFAQWCSRANEWSRESKAAKKATSYAEHRIQRGVIFRWSSTVSSRIDSSLSLRSKVFFTSDKRAVLRSYVRWRDWVHFTFSQPAVIGMVNHIHRRRVLLGSFDLWRRMTSNNLSYRNCVVKARRCQKSDMTRKIFSCMRRQFALRKKRAIIWSLLTKRRSRNVLRQCVQFWFAHYTAKRTNSSLLLRFGKQLHSRRTSSFKELHMMAWIELVEELTSSRKMDRRSNLKNQMRLKRRAMERLLTYSSPRAGWKKAVSRFRARWATLRAAMKLRNWAQKTRALMIAQHIESLVAKLDAGVGSLEHMVATAIVQARSRTAELNDLQNTKVPATEQKLAQVREQLDLANVQFEVKDSEVSSARVQLSVLNDTITEMRTRMEQSQEQGATETSFSALQRDLQTERRQQTLLRTQLDSKEKEVLSLSTHVASFTEKLSKTETELESLQFQVAGHAQALQRERSSSDLKFKEFRETWLIQNEAEAQAKEAESQALRTHVSVLQSALDDMNLDLLSSEKSAAGGLDSDCRVSGSDAPRRELLERERQMQQKEWQLDRCGQYAKEIMTNIALVQDDARTIMTQLSQHNMLITMQFSKRKASSAGVRNSANNSHKIAAGTDVHSLESNGQWGGETAAGKERESMDAVEWKVLPESPKSVTGVEPPPRSLLSVELSSANTKDASSSSDLFYELSSSPLSSSPEKWEISAEDEDLGISKPIFSCQGALSKAVFPTLGGKSSPLDKGNENSLVGDLDVSDGGSAADSLCAPSAGAAVLAQTTGTAPSKKEGKRSSFSGSDGLLPDEEIISGSNFVVRATFTPCSHHNRQHTDKEQQPGASQLKVEPNGHEQSFEPTTPASAGATPVSRTRPKRRGRASYRMDSDSD